MKEVPANPKEMRPRVSICEASGSATRLQDASLPLSPSAVKELAQTVVGYFEFSSCAINRRSRCGAVRGWPVFNWHFSPGAAPQVGQRIASIRFGPSSFFITGNIMPEIRYAEMVKFEQSRK
jgi:hypothetical protein